MHQKHYIFIWIYEILLKFLHFQNEEQNMDGKIKDIINLGNLGEFN